MFGPDGRYAFICSSFTPELTVLEVVIAIKSSSVCHKPVRFVPTLP